MAGANKEPDLLSTKLNILVVEDNRVNQAIVAGILKRLGFTVNIACNGIEALQLLSGESSVLYDAIIMDCQMPELDGYETTLAIRSGKAGDKYCDIIIIAMTANDSTNDIEKCLSSGMNDYMAKPVSASHLNNKLVNHITEYNNEYRPLLSNTTESVEPISEEQMLNTSQNIVWDKAALYNRVSQNEALATALIQLFIEESPVLMDKLLSAIEQHDYSNIAILSHKFLGSCGNIGGKVIFAQLKTIEMAAKQCDSNKINTLSVNLKNNFNQLLMEISK